MQKQGYLSLKQYQLVNKIDSGTLSEVYRVKAKNSDNLYAAKIISKTKDQNLETATNNFLPEFSKISRFVHGSIHKLIGLSPVNFQNEKKPVIISEFLGNGTLKEIITLDRRSKSAKYLNETRKLITIYGIASAMSFLHSYSIIHRDLKPSNILMDDYLCPQITDIELTKFFQPDPKTTNSTIYLSPEILSKSEYSLAGDVYAFGIIVYELITNEEPNVIKQRFINKSHPKFNSNLPSSYRQLIERCLSPNSLIRPSFSEIVKELREDSGFITEKIEKEDYLDYIKYLDQYNSLVTTLKRPIQINEFIKRDSSTFKLTEVHIGQYKIKLSPSEKAAQLFERGLTLYKKSDKENAVKIFKEASDLGHIESMFLYATMNLNGEGIEKNLKEASDYFKKAADLGKPEAMFNYAKMCNEGHGIPENKEIANKYYEKAAEKGHIASMQELAFNLTNGKGIQQNKEKASIYYKKAADKGNIKSMHNYAKMLQNGDGIPINKKEAEKYYKKAIEKGNTDSMYEYGKMLQNGDGIPINEQLAIELYKKSIKEGNVNSIFQYASLLYDGSKTTPSNKQEAAKLYKKAADKGYNQAIYNYGIMLFKGDGIKENKKEAALYFKKAADKGYTDAIYNYALILDNGDGIPSNKKEAIKYYKKAIDKNVVPAMLNYALLKYKDDKKEAAKYFKMAADKGRSNAMHYYAIMIFNGDGIETNKKVAEKYYKMAINKGYVKSMYNYAKMLFDGDGIPSNKKEAVLLYKKAADKGHLGSINNYAMLLFKGEGIEQNKEKAAELFKIAADKGFVSSMFYLALMLYKGDGIKQDKKKSAFYYKKAADNDHIVSMFNFALMLYNGDSIPCDKEKAGFYFKKAADKGDIDAMYSYYLMLKKGEIKNADKKESARYFKMAVDKGYKNSKIEDLSELYSMEDKGQIKFKLDNNDDILFDHNESSEIIKKLPYKGMIEASNSISILVDDYKLIRANTEVVCNNGLEYNDFREEIKEEIREIQKGLSLNNFQLHATIEYLPQNDKKNDDLIAPINYNDIDDDDAVVNVDPTVKQKELIDLKRIPKPSKVVKIELPPSQLYLLTHDKPKIPEESKIENVRKFIEDESKAKSITEFNNAILKMSRYKQEMEDINNDEAETKHEDPLLIFRSRHRTKKT